MIICHLIFTAASCSQIYFYIRVRPPFQFTKMIGSEMSISTDQNRRPHQLPYTFKISREFSSFSNFTVSEVNFDFKSSKCSLIKLKGAILYGQFSKILIKSKDEKTTSRQPGLSNGTKYVTTPRNLTSKFLNSNEKPFLLIFSKIYIFVFLTL